MAEMYSIECNILFICSWTFGLFPSFVDYEPGQDQCLKLTQVIYSFARPSVEMGVEGVIVAKRPRASYEE